MHVHDDLTAVFKVVFGGVNICGTGISELAGVKVSKGTGMLWQLQTRAHIPLSVAETRKRVYAAPSSLNLHTQEGVCERILPASKQQLHHEFTSSKELV